VVVLSNNDGCVVARSPEARALGIPMGRRGFSAATWPANTRWWLCPATTPLRRSQRRLMAVLGRFAPRQEIYSIDECFLDLSGLEWLDPTAFCQATA